jgi:sporulation protein YlmC with PRC-barrel domain
MRDEASVGPDPRRARELKRLSDLKFRVASGEPDIVGWTVFASTGRELGRVTDLLVDVEAREVVMLDIDLRRGDQHTLAPLRAAWIDHAAKRVVLDARELEQNSDELLPGLPRSGALSDAQVDRFNEHYVRAYGDRGVEQDSNWRVRRGDEELRFGVEPRADLQAEPRRDDRHPSAGAAGAAGAAGGALAAGTAGGPHFDESRRIDSIMEGHDTHRDADRSEPRRLLDQDAHRASQHTGMAGMAGMGGGMGAAGSGDDLRAVDRDMTGGDRRVDRVDDASALHPTGAIDPRELDGRVRIDEGATVDERAPVGGVRYEGGSAAPHDYGRPDERYGPEYGSGRIGFNRVVSRHPRSGDDPADLPMAGGAGDSMSAPRQLDDAGDRTLDRTLDRTSDERHEVRFRRYEDTRRPDQR